MDAVEINPHELVSGVVKLASLPGVYFEVKRLVDDPDATMSALGEVISRDPGLTARLLRIANSAFFGFASRIETVSRAVAILGFQQIHDLALATSVTSAFDGISPDLMDMERFWRSSVYCGVVARILATRCNVLDSERLFVEGLLRDIGHLVLYDRLPGETARALERSREEGRPLFRVERETIGFDYAQVGAILMREWRLPESLQESVHHHPEPARARDYPLETAIVHLAAVIVDGGGADLAALPVDPAAWRLTGLAPEDLEGLLEEADRRAAETVELFLPRAGTSG